MSEKAASNVKPAARLSLTLPVLVVTLVLSLTALVLYHFGPHYLETRGLAETELRAAQLGQVFHARLDSADPTAALLDLARHNRDILYLVALDNHGQVTAAYNWAGAEYAGFLRADDDTAPRQRGTVYRARLAPAAAPQLRERLYLGLSTAALHSAMSQHQRFMAGVSLMLLCLSIGLVATAGGIKRLEGHALRTAETGLRLRQQNAALEREMAEGKRAVENLRESEQRYRSLFESTMASAYDDLERQKADLEREVVERKRAEEALRWYTERLKAINDIERNMLSGSAPQAIARTVLGHLDHLIPHHRAFVVEYEYFTGEGIVLAHGDPGEQGMEVGTRLPLALFENMGGLLRNEIRYEEDLAALPNPSAIERAMLGEGVHSYLYVPLVFQDEIVGSLFHGAAEARAYLPEQIDIVREASDLMAVNIRQTRIDRERELYESELLTAKERAEEMARLKSTFLTNMSHEIRTPLSGIIGFAQVLNEEISDEHSEFAALIEESARRLLDTINSVLDLAQLESNRITLRPEKLDMTDAVDRAVRLLEALADKKDLRLEALHALPTLYAHLDRAGLDRVLTNLVGNAIKFTDTGGITIETDADGNQVILRVRDTGIGIGPEFLPHLFDEFKQESTGANRMHEGSGLGLAITNKLVGRMGGTISVESEKGVGTTFTVCFPQAVPEATARTPHRERPAARVLIVEDKEDATFLLEYLLRGAYAVQFAPDVPGALRLAEAARYDAVLVDINLGDLGTATDLVSQLRRLPGYAQVPLLATATQVLPDDWSVYLDVGYDGFVTEPFVSENLFGALEGIARAAS